MSIEVPTTLSGMLDELDGTFEQLADRLTIGGSAYFDQQVARARAMADAVGLDLDDPKVAETVVRMSFAITATSSAMMTHDGPGIQAAALTAPHGAHVAAHARWVAAGQLAKAAHTSLTLGPLPDTSGPTRRSWWPWRRRDG